MQRVFEIAPEVLEMIEANMKSFADSAGCSPEEMGERLITIGMQPIDEALCGAINKFLTK